MLSAEQLAERTQYVGASEAAPIIAAEFPELGLDTYQSAIDVWRAKVEGSTFSGNVYTRIGDALEPVTIAQYAAEFGVDVLPSPGTRRHQRFPVVAATPDGIVATVNSITGKVRRIGIEVKAPVTEGSRAAWWDADGEPCAPDHYFVQCQMQAEVCGFDAVHLCALIDGRLEVRIIERDPELGALWAETIASWWARYVEPRVEPPARDVAERVASVARRFKKSNGRLLDPTPEDLDAGQKLAAIRAQTKALEAEAEELEATLKERIGEAEGIRGVATWKTDSAGRVAWKAVAEALRPPAELVAAHTLEPTRKFLLKVKAAKESGK